MFDTHLHLDLFSDPKAILENIEKQKIYTIAVTNLPKVFFNTKNLCEGFQYIRPSLGYHPELIFKFGDQLDLFCQLLSETRYIGEVGLDNQRKTSEDFAIQKQMFEKIISACAEKKDKILTIHSRKAEKEVISIIGDNFPGKVILHWYSGTLRELEKALSYGFYFSINSAMIQSKNGLNIIKNIPVDRFLLESDSPFIGVNKESKVPLDFGIILKQLAILKDYECAAFKKKLKCNFKNILILD